MEGVDRCLQDTLLVCRAGVKILSATACIDGQDSQVSTVFVRCFV